MGSDAFTIVLVVRHDMAKSQRITALVYTPEHGTEPAAEWYPTLPSSNQTFLSIEYDGSSRSWELSGCNYGEPTPLEQQVTGEEEDDEAFHVVVATWKEKGLFQLAIDNTESTSEVSDADERKVKHLARDR